MYITTKQKQKARLNVGIVTGSVLCVILLIILSINLFSIFAQGVHPRNVLVANFDPTSVTITWVTDIRAEGLVRIYSNGEKVGEFRDVRGNSSFLTHYIDVQGLEPSTNYTFEIISGTEVYSREGGNSFLFSTAKFTGDSPVPNLVGGSLDGDYNGDALVFLVSDEHNTPPLATYLSKAGEWSLDLSKLRNVSLDEHIGIDRGADTRLKLLFLSDGGSKIVVGNNNVIFDSNRLLGNVKLDEDIDIFLSMERQTVQNEAVMGVTEEPTDEEIVESSIEWKPLN